MPLSSKQFSKSDIKLLLSAIYRQSKKDANYGSQAQHYLEMDWIRCRKRPGDDERKEHKEEIKTSA